MKKYVLIVLSVICATACESSTEKAREIHDELVYFKDHRTDKCFALWKAGGDQRTTVLANVSCDEKVERLLVNGAERGR